MPWDRPTLAQLISRTLTDVNQRFEGTYNRLRRKVNAVFARVLAGLAHGLYGYIDYVAGQIHTDTQDEVHLLRDGAQFGVVRVQAASASGSIGVTGTDGTLIDAGTVFQKSDGAEYVTQADAEVSGGAASIAVKASTEGVAGNADTGTQLSLVSPIAGLDSTALVASPGLSGGRDIESIDAYRLRVKERKATFYTGANAAVYIKWAKEVAAVTRAWAYENTPSAGSLTVLFVCDDDGIIPDAGRIADVEDYLEEHADPVTGALVGRAVNCTLVVDGPTADVIDFTLLPSPNTAAVQAAIEAELTDLFRREAVPAGTLPLSHIREAISNAAGENDYVLTTPAADVSSASGHIATLGTITWA